MPAKIPVSNGKQVIVDDRDHKAVKDIRWHAVKSGNSEAVRCNVPGKNRGSKSLHSMLLKPPKGTVVIHLNGDAYDCRRANLKVAHRGAGQAARKNRSSKGFTSPYYGVSWNSGTEKWQVVMRVKGKPKWIGAFKDEIAAAEAYDQAAYDLHGERALLNFP